MPARVPENGSDKTMKLRKKSGESVVVQSGESGDTVAFKIPMVAEKTPC
jgi:hypothetical protein